MIEAISASDKKITTWSFQVFAKLKTLLLKAAERSVEATWKRIGALLQAFTPQECADQHIVWVQCGDLSPTICVGVRLAALERSRPGPSSPYQKG
jgi:hypothetical protein